jgi:hypothetical protein
LLSALTFLRVRKKRRGENTNPPSPQDFDTCSKENVFERLTALRDGGITNRTTMNIFHPTNLEKKHPVGKHGVVPRGVRLM